MPAALVLMLVLAAAGEPCDFRPLALEVRGSLAASFDRVLGAEGAQVAAHAARLFMWDLDLRHDVVAGDEVRLLWRPTEGGEVEIAAASYRSQHLGGTLLAYRFKSSDDAYPSYWDDAGLERARRLKGGPLAGYDQVTALLKDRPTHKGMDFKTPIGTEVRSPRAATVSRADWKRSGNGRCLELRYSDGMIAKFLHLSAIKVRVGERVRAGQLIALTGNTGHSTAPHLHYQLGPPDRPVDPVDYHGVARRKLPAGDLAALRTTIATLEKSCGALAAIPAAQPTTP